jgi:iron(III) transport system permease protein
MHLAAVLRNMKKHTNGWLIASLLGAAIILLPILTIFISVFQPPNENWMQIKQYLLQDYVLQSVWLLFFTGFFTLLIGVALAWLVAAYEFPLKAFFRWALMLPLAIPPYIAAYTYGSMLSYTGFVQKSLRDIGVILSPKVFDIMSIRGAVFIFTMFLFPYVYVITRSYLERQSGSYIENAMLLGRRPLSIFISVVLPLSRPAIVGGIILVAFEVLSDYGVSSYFGIQTFTTAIFKTWFGMYDIESATRLAAWLMVGTVGIIMMERLLRGNRKFSATTSRSNPLKVKRLQGISAWGAALFCVIIFAFSFLIPVIQLGVWAKWTYSTVLTADFWQLTSNTIVVALAATALITIFAVIVAITCRIQSHTFSFVLSKLVTSGYSIPGAIIAIGVLALFIWLDKFLAPFYGWIGKGESPLVLSLSIVMLIVAYVVRFTATGYNAVEAGCDKVGLKYMEASRMLGMGITKTFFKVDLPLIKGAIISGVILTFVEIVKELPLALLLRPFNFETLATKTYQYANDEKIFQAAIPSLMIIGVSMISVLIFHQLTKKVER